MPEPPKNEDSLQKEAVSDESMVKPDQLSRKRNVRRNYFGGEAGIHEVHSASTNHECRKHALGNCFNPTHPFGRFMKGCRNSYMVILLAMWKM